MYLPIMTAIAFLLLSRVAIIGLYKKQLSEIKSDGITHFHIFNQIRKKKDHRKWPNFLYDQQNSNYPALFHHITAKLFSTQKVEQYPWLPNLIYFVLGSGVYISMTATFVHYTSNLNLMVTTLMITGLFIVSMNNLDFSKNRIHYLDFSERLLSKFCVSFYVLFMYFTLTINTSFSVVCILLCAITMLMSQFGRQAITLFSCLLSLLLWSYLPIAILICGILFTFLIARRAFYDGIIDWLKYMRSYQKIMQNSVANQEKLSKLYSIDELKRKLDKSVLHTIYYLISQEPFISIITGASSLLLLYFHYFTPHIRLPEISIPFLIIPFIASFITAMKPFRFIGQSYRYIEYLSYLFPIIYLGLVSTQYWETISIYIIIYVCITMLYAGSKWVMFTKSEVANKRMEDLKDIIRKCGISEKNVVLMLYAKESRDIVYLTNCKTVFYQTYIYFDTAVNFFEKGYFPFVTSEYMGLLNTYNVDTIVVNRKMLNTIDIEYDLAKFKKVYDNGTYDIYNI